MLTRFLHRVWVNVALRLGSLEVRRVYMQTFAECTMPPSFLQNGVS